MSAPRRDGGYALVALVAGVTVMLILMGAAMPTWKYVIQSDREEELFARGDEIASAIERYQRMNGGTLPVSIDQLVKGRFLRRAYKDPMTPGGKWRFLRPGEPGVPLPGGGRGPGGRPGPSPSPQASPSSGLPLGADSGGGPQMGAFVGVVSTSREKSYRLMNGQDSYDKWMFVAGQPRMFGKLLPTVPAGPGGGRGRPGPSPPAGRGGTS